MTNGGDERALQAHLVQTGQVSPQQMAHCLAVQQQRGGPMAAPLRQILFEQGLPFGGTATAQAPGPPTPVPPPPSYATMASAPSHSIPPAYPPPPPPLPPPPGSGAYSVVPGGSLTMTASVRAANAHKIGRYEIRDELGRGAMGVVYRCHDPGLERDVAVKMVVRGEVDETTAKRFRREAQAVAKLDHPHIVPVYEVGDEDGRPYIVMKYIAGKSLREVIKDEKLDARRVAELVRDLAEALEHAHQNGILHRDVKPQNVLVAPNGHCYLTDFGLAKDEDGSMQLTIEGEALGTPAYMAPEQTGGNNDDQGPHSDVYALGAVLYTCLVGRPPFQGKRMAQLLKQVLFEKPVPPRQVDEQVPAALDKIAMRCLEKEPKNRFQSAAEVVEALERFLAGKPVTLGLGSGQRARVTSGRRPTGSRLPAATRRSTSSGVRRGVAATRRPSGSGGARTSSRASSSGQRAAASDRLAERWDRGRKTDMLVPILLALGVVVALGLLGAWVHLREPVIGVPDDSASAPDEGAPADGATPPAASPDDGEDEAPPGEGEGEGELGLTDPPGVDDDEPPPSRDDPPREVARDPDPPPDPPDPPPARRDPPPAGERAPVVPDGSRSPSALVIDGASVPWLYEPIKAIQEKRFDDALRMLTEVIEQNDKDADAFFLRSCLRAMMGESVASSMADIEAAIAANPDHVQSLVRRASLRSTMNDMAGALADLDRALEVEPTSLPALTTRAQIRAQARNFAAAREDVDAALRLQPRDPSLLALRAGIRFESRDFAGALADAEASLAIKPTAGALMERGNAHAALGNYPQAIADFERVLRALPPSDPRRPSLTQAVEQLRARGGGR